MPSPADLKKAFTLEPGAQLAGNITVTRCDCDHRVAQLNESEEFPTEVTVSLTKGATRDQALAAFKEHVKKSKIVHSQFGKPWEVTFGTPQLSKEDEGAEGSAEGGGMTVATIVCLATAKHRHDMSTLSQSAEEERSHRGIPTRISAEDQAGLLGDDYRVMRASLEGVCGECGDKIVPGDAVCTPLASDDPARWAHEACTLAKLKREKASTGQ